MTQLIFPTKEEFLESIHKRKKEIPLHEVMIEFYDDWANENAIWDIIGDYTSESINEDEHEWVKNKTPEELWNEMFEDYETYVKKQAREKVPWGVVEKYLTDDDLKTLQFIKDNKLLEKI